MLNEIHEFNTKNKYDQKSSENLNHFIDFFINNKTNPDLQGYCTLFRVDKIPNMDKINKAGYPYRYKKKLKDIGSFSADSFAEKVSSIFYGKSHDYYITLNRMKSPHGKKLFGLNAFMIDLNDHFDFSSASNKGRRSWAMNMLNAVVYDIVNGGIPGIPNPNAIVYTGRGIQLWYKVAPASYKMKKVYTKVVEKYVRKVKEFIDGSPYSDYICVSKNKAEDYTGLVRLPGTYNTNYGTYGDFFILHENEIDLAEEVKGWKKEQRQKYVWFYAPKKGMPAQREKALSKLLRIREGKKQERELYTVIIYNTYRSITGDDELAMRRVHAFNKNFNHPLDAKQIDAYLASSKEAGGYKYSNAKIIELLSITEDEQTEIGFTEFHNTRNDPDDIADRRYQRRCRDQEILKLAKKTMMTQTEIAEKVDSSKATVCRVLKKYRRKTGRQRAHNSIVRMLRKNISVKQVYNKYKEFFSLSEIYYLASKVKELAEGEIVYAKGFFCKQKKVSHRSHVRRGDLLNDDEEWDDDWAISEEDVLDFSNDELVPLVFRTA